MQEQAQVFGLSIMVNSPLDEPYPMTFLTFYIAEDHPDSQVK